ncbi:2-dehydropantoate 2-reductase (Ketopantoate reductase) (KPA reductase) (KPR) [Fusarium oxysporum]|nr:2-dehydropantoate 2-reductase (Ketopantoate reductase) (KPA reductase) (KPR) [Fusarium oxysporum]
MIAKAVTPRVHVLGLGSIGTFAAHSLAEVPPPLTPSITLLLHRESLVDQYRRNGSQITLQTGEGEIISHGDYNLEVLQDGQWHSASSTCCETTPIRNMTVQDDIIDNLIVSVKGPQTSSALRPLKHRLNASSHILFLQNGTGMIEDVKKHVFTKEETRPNFITGGYITWSNTQLTLQHHPYWICSNIFGPCASVRTNRQGHP